jgi:N-acetylglutamate synthase-like GNAT family acetyltransferase
MATDLSFTVHDDVSPDDAAAVDHGLDQANRSTPLQDVRRLSALARREGVVVGGAIGRTWGQCCELQQLWVSAEHRHRGVGSRLLQEFERRAQERGCRLVYLDTFSFQAPAFYKAHGYAVTHEVQGFTQDAAKYTMTKALTS